MPENTTTKFRVDITDLKKNIAEANRQIRLANAEFKSATAGMDSWATSADGLSAKISQQQKVLKSQKVVLEDYKKQLELIVKEYGENSKEADEMRIKVENQTAAVKKTEKEINNYQGDLDNLGKEMVETEEETADLSEGFTVMKGVLSNLITQGINLAVNALKDLAKAAKEAYSEFDTGRDEVIKATGATGEAAKAMTKSYKNVAKTVKADMSTVGKAVGEVSTKFRLQGEELEDLSEFFLKFSEITNTDVTTSVDKAQKAMSAYGLETKDTKAFLDTLAATAQATGVSVEKLADGIVSNGTAFQEMGLSVEEAVGLMGQLEMSGVNSETVLNGMRKALKNSAKEGISINEALSKLQKTIDNSKTSTEGLNAAYEVFGKSGDQIYGAIKNGTLDFNNFAKAAENSSDAVVNTYDETQSAMDRVALKTKAMKVELGSFVNNVVTKYEPDIMDALDKAKEKAKEVYDGVKKLFDYMKTNEKTITKAVKAVGAAFITWKFASLIASLVKALKAFSLAAKAASVAQAALNVVMNANPIALIVTAIAGLVAAFVTLWNKSEAFRDFWIELWESIKGVAQPILENTVSAFQTAWDAIRVVIEAIKAGFEALWADVKPIVDNIVGAFQEAWETLKVIWSYIEPFVQAVIDTVVPLITGAFSSAWEAIKLVWDAVSGYFTAIFETIKTVFSAVVSVLPGFFKNAWEAIKLVWKAVTGYFENIWNTIKNIFSVVKNVLSGDFKGAWEAIKNIFSGWGEFFSGLWEGVKNVFKGVKDWFGGVFEEAWKAIKGVFDTWGSFFSGLWDTISSTFSDIGTNIGNAISGSVKAGINGILSTLESVVNKAISLINGVMDVINDIPGVDIGNIDEISLPRLEKGGVLKKGQVGILEGNGAEAVVPLERNKHWIGATAKELKRSLEVQGVTGSGKTVINNHYNYSQTNNSPKSLSRLDIYRQTRNQLAFSKGGA